MGQEFINYLKAQGIKFIEDISVDKVEKVADGFLLTDGTDFEHKTDLVIAGVGRQPNSDKLNLEKVGVETDAKGIKVNEYLQTSNSKIYAMGDVLSKNQPHLTPVSSFEGAYLGENLVKDEPQKKLLIQQFLQSFLERQNWLRLAIWQVRGFILRL